MTEGGSRPPLGRGLLSGGYVLISVALGVALGYWASDREIRFFPTMLATVFTLGTAGLSLFALGAQLEREERDRRSIGRRAVVSAALALAGLLGLLALFVASRPTALTTMADAELRRAHELDARYVRDLDRTLRGLVSEVEAHRSLFHTVPPRVPTEEEERLLLDAWIGFLETATPLDQVRRFHQDFYRFDLSRMERSQHEKSFLLTFACELSLYENTYRLLSLFASNPNVETFLNLARPDRGLEPDSVARARATLSGVTDLGRVTAGRRYLAYLDQVHQARTDLASESFSFLWRETEHYGSAFTRRSSSEAVAMSVAGDFAPILRRTKHAAFPLQKEIAEWMGDTRLERSGGRHLVTGADARAMEETLLPGDVLLSRKNWYLSNVALPGFWPHAILYVGSNEALATAFDADRDVREWVRSQSGEPIPYSEYLERTYPLAWSGREAGSEEPRLTVIEAVSEGVLQNSLFGASGDFVVALRPRLKPLTKAQAIFRAFSFLDRPYDFDFDFATDGALVCTEVVWRAYRPKTAGAEGLHLEPRSVAGRLTLPANDIARTFRDERGRSDRQLDFVYYLEGRELANAAVVADEDSFVATVDRSKWDFGR